MVRVPNLCHKPHVVLLIFTISIFKKISEFYKNKFIFAFKDTKSE